MIKITITDETLRDGSQGNVIMTPAFKINHLLHMTENSWANRFRIGWHSNPADQMVLDWVSFNRPDLIPFITMPTLLFRSDDFSQDQEDFCKDIRFGVAVTITKGKPEDLIDLGMNIEELMASIRRTGKKIRQVQQSKIFDIAIEHAFSSYLAGNADFLVYTIETALLSHADKIILADTDGELTPSKVKEVIVGLTKKLQNSENLKLKGINFTADKFSIHAHNDLGLSAANSLAALEVGVRELDVSLNHYGERAGNTRLLQIATIINQSSVFDCCIGELDLPKLAKYCDELHKQLGTTASDKTLGSADAYNAVGGMHASKLLKELRSTGKKGIKFFQEFTSDIRGYTGSYNSVSAQKFGQRISVTLSPVAGRANVQFMLEELGFSNISKDDERLDNVLKAVKWGEFQRGENYRGKNNVNAKLLIAEIFDARNIAGEKNRFSLSTNQHITSILFSMRGEKFLLNIPNLNQYANYMSINIFCLNVAARLIFILHKILREKLGNPSDIKLENVCHYKVDVGDLYFSNGRVKAEKQLDAIKLKFSMENSSEHFLSTGVGKTIIDAVVSSVEKAVDYLIFQYEVQLSVQKLTGLIDKNFLKEQAEKIGITPLSGSKEVEVSSYSFSP